jgi:hypothetical protein
MSGELLKKEVVAGIMAAEFLELMHFKESLHI